jgi:hypothetical protein
VASGTHTLAPAATFSGAGALAISGGTFNVNGTTSIATFDLSSGTLGGAGTVTANNAFNWSGGTIATGGAGSTNVAPGAALNITSANPKTLNGGKLNIAGTATWTGGGNVLLENGSVLSNSGTFDVQTDADFQHTTGATPTFNNSGVLKKTVATGETVIGAQQYIPVQQYRHGRTRKAAR